MKDKKNSKVIKRSVDVLMTVLLLCLMAYQVTGDFLHEWIGIGMTVTVIVHQIFNRKWYGALFKGRYTGYRILLTAAAILLLLSMAMTAVSGMSMSGHAVPFMYGMVKVSLARQIHLSMSHWSFVLMGIHLGLHVPVITAGFKITDKVKTVLSALFCLAAGAGLYFFIQNRIFDYLFFRVPFAFLDYEKAGVLVFAENILILIFWAFLGEKAALISGVQSRSSDKTNKKPIHLIFVLFAVIIGLVLNMIFSKNTTDDMSNSGREPSAPETSSQITESTVSPTSGDETVQTSAGPDLAKIGDNFLLINGGKFLMGSPETENWRIEDETQHEVSVSSFYIDPYETTQTEYERLMGSNPSNFKGEKLPVENISWLDAIAFANAKSKEAGLTPVYTVTEDGVSWDISANGYRLPTEAEWEYACRAGTVTQFNLKKSLDATEANFYGHYPYEIEENYFNDSVLEARPGEYRETTVDVGSFRPNDWGLYDCHGNVNEWCWDYYGDYDVTAKTDPTGAATGTRHVYRGGGWNDFGKNMRSAYRAAGEADLASYNLGVRLVRNADYNRTGTVNAKASDTTAKAGGKVLIVYFSWGGNTRMIANEIQKQTGADIFEITLVKPYSSSYNTVLMQAQEDQHNQARPEIKGKVENWDQYDTIILGYPNWWASIPMPIASFLEQYDFTNKRILPFCSHGGGKFGQSLTAIAKLAPDAVLEEGLSIHYSGGSAMPKDVSAWLKENGII